MTRPSAIVAMGACTPVGSCVWSSAAAVRAGLTGFTTEADLRDAVGEPVRVARVEAIDRSAAYADRLELLVSLAVEEALESVGGRFARSCRTSLVLALPGARPGRPLSLDGQLMDRLLRRFDRAFVAHGVVSAGHAAGLLAMGDAMRQLDRGSVDACLVAAVDGYLEPQTLEWLEDNDQLHGAGALNNAWGFVPGEAGAALALTTHATAAAESLPVFGVVEAVGEAREAHRIKTESVCLGEGLTDAFRSALDTMPTDARVTDVYCDLNGETYRANEYGFTVLRTRERFHGPSDFVAPADCWGDVGAAGALLHASLACVAGRKGYANGSRALVWASAESGERAAARLLTATAR